MPRYMNGWYLPIRLYKRHYFIDVDLDADSQKAVCGMTISGTGSDLHESNDQKCKKCQHIVDNLVAKGLI